MPYKKNTIPSADLTEFATKIDETVIASDFSEQSKQKAHENEAEKSS